MADRTVSVRLEAIVDTYNQRMSSAASATEGVGRAGDTAGRKISDAMQSAARTAGQVTLVAAGAGTALLTSALKTGTAYNTLEQTSRAAFKTVLGSQEAAAEMMEKVAAFAKTSPFPRQAFIEGTQQLLAFGMEADNVIPTLSAIQDAMAAAGKGSQEIGEVVNIFAQVQSTGKITADTLNQLGYRGVDAAKLLGDAFGVSANEIRTQISEGTLDAATALEVLTAAMTETFGGAAEGVKDTWVGAVDRVKGAWRDISSIIAEPFVTKAGGGLALDWVNAIASGMRDAEKHVTPMMEILTGRLAPAFDLVSNSIQGTRDRIQAWDVQSFIDGLDGLAKYAAPIGGVTAALLAMGANLPILSSLGIAGVNPLVAGLTAMVVLSPELRDVAKTLVDGLRPAGPAFKDLAKQAGDTANAILASLAPAAGVLVSEFTPLVPVIAQVATGMLASLQTGAETLAPSLTRLVEAIAPAISALGNTVLQTAAQGFSDVVTKITPEVARLIDTVAPLAGILGADLASAAGAALGAVSPLITMVASLIGVVADLPTPVLAAATAFTVLSVGPVAGLVAMLGGALVGAVGAARTAMTTLTTSMAASQAVAATMGTQVSRVGTLALTARAGVSSLRTALVAAFISNPVGIAIAGIAAALGIFIMKQNDARSRTEAYSEAVKLMAGEMETASRTVAATAFATGEGLDWGWFQKLNSGYSDFMTLAGDLGISLSELSATVTMSGDRYDAWVVKVKAAAEANGVKSAAADELITKTRQQRGALDEATDAQEAATEAERVGADATNINTEKIKAQTDAVNANNDAIIDAAELFISAREAGRRYAESLQTVSEKINENNGVLADANATEEDRAVAIRSSNDELDKLATASLRVLERNREQGASTAELTQQTADLRQALIDQAGQMGMSAEEAAAYVDALGLIPGDYIAKVSVETEVARATLEAWKSSMTNQFDVPVTPIIDENGKEKLVVDFAELGKMEPTIDVFADGAKARAEAQTTLEVIDQTGMQGRTWVVQADGTLALSEAKTTESTISNMNPRAMTIDGDGNSAVAEAGRVRAIINGMSAAISVGVVQSAAFMPGLRGLSAAVSATRAAVTAVQRADGGSVFGPGTSTSDSIPALLSNGEHVLTAREVQAMGGHSAVERMRAGALAGALPRFASGGAVNAARTQYQARLSAQQAAYRRSYSAMMSHGLDSDAYRAAKVVEDAAREALEDTAKQVARLTIERNNTTRSIRRGEITSQATSGLSGAYSVVDDLKSLSQNKDIPQVSRDGLARRAAASEASMNRLYKSAEGIEKKLDAAKDRVAELGAISSGVASKLSGEFTLGEASKDQYGYDATSGGIVGAARGKAAQIKAFAGKLKKLQAMGLSGVALQEVAGLGSAEGSAVADALIAGGAADVKGLNAAYTDIAKWSGQAGQYVTEGFYKGGLQAATGLVKGLESQQAAIEKQILKIAKAMEKSLKNALGIKSPSRVFRDLMNPVGDGTVLGLADQEPKLRRAAVKYGEYLTPSLTSPGFAGSSWMAPGMAPATANQNAPMFDVAALVQAVRQGVTGSTFIADVRVGARAAADVTRVGAQELARSDRRILQKAVNG